MADNWIQSFAVALGFDVDTSSLNAAKKSIADYEAAVKAAEKRIEDARWAGAKTEEEIAKLTRETNLKEAKEALAAAHAKEKAEKEAAQKREERNKAFIAGVEKMALAATAAATAIGYAVNRVTSAFYHMGFVSARTGASVQSLNSLGYAFKQVGGTSEQAVAAVESFTKAMRENSGVKGFVQGLGVDMTKDRADQLLDTVRILQGHGYDAGSREAGLAGISEENYALLTKYIDEIDRYRAEYNKLTASLGVDSKQATEVSMAFHRSLTRLQATASALGDKLMVTLAPALQRIVDRFQNWIRSNPEKVQHIMDGISKALVWVAEKIAAVIESITGSNGDAFIKRWDAFAERAERFATAVERIAKASAQVSDLLDKFNGKEASGVGSLSTWLLEKMGVLPPGSSGGSGVPGVGAIGGFNPLQPGAPAQPHPDNRTWWERHAPTALGGKPDPNATPDHRGGVFRRAARALRGDHSDGIAANPGAYKDVLDHIARSEGTATQPGGGYNTSLGYGRYLPGGKEQNLTSMTLDQILALGDHMRRQPGNPNSSALGRYQIVGSTLRDQMRKLGLKGSDLFDEKMQDRIAANLARQRGASPNGLRQEWASLVGAKNATAVALMQKVDPKASTIPLDRPHAPEVAQRGIERSAERQAAPVSPDRASASSIHVSSPKIEVTGGGSGSSAAPVINVPGLPRMMQMPDFDPVQLMQLAPSAAYSVVNNGGSTSKAVHQTFNTNTTIHEARNVREAGRTMEGTFGRMHELALENAQSAIA